MSNDCDCCTAPPGLENIPRQNRPGLPAVRYRLGTFATLRQTMLDELSRSGELDRLRSRVGDDYSISVIEMWAAVADVLTFYSERIANEAFIRTATSRDSVLRLVRLLDYHLAPGTAARTLLGFTLEPATAVTIPMRTRVQTVPAQGEKPQKYETLEPLAADARLNRLRLYPAPVFAERGPFALGTSTAFAAPEPDSVAAVAALAEGDRLLVYSASAVELLTVADVTSSDELLKVTWTAPITTENLQPTANDPDKVPTAYRLGRTIHLFGTDAPRKVYAATDLTKNPPIFGFLETDFTVHGDDTSDDWISLDGRYDNLSSGAKLLLVSGKGNATKTLALPIKATGEKGVQRTAKTDDNVVVVSATVTQVELEGLSDSLATLVDDVREITIYELLGEPLRFWRHDYPQSLTTETVCLPGARVGWSTIEIERTISKGRYRPGIRLSPTDIAVDRRVVIADAGGAPAVVTIAAAGLTGSDVTITADTDNTDTLAQLGLGAAATATTALVSAPLPAKVQLEAKPELAVTIGTLPPQNIALDLNEGEIETADIATKLQNAIRSAMTAEEGFALAVVWVDTVAERTDPCNILVAAGIPGVEVRFTHTDNDDHTVAALRLDAVHARFADGLLSGPLKTQKVDGKLQVQIGFGNPSEREISLPAESAAQWAPKLAEKLELAVAAATDDRLMFLPRLPVPADREWLRLTLSTAPVALNSDTAYLVGNVADASHGETVRDEVVGDGDASVAFQQFRLTKKPVTVLSAPTPSGLASSLQLFVNGEMWTEVPTLFGTSPSDHVFVTRTADDGTTTVGFGDGEHGARPASGRHNIVATYRTGSGIAGRARPQSLRTLLDRATGVKAATNPLPGEGGSDAEALENARQSAPGSVRTFGRAVSLLDFEDASLTNREVAKSRSQWVWAGHQRIVHLTVAGQGGATFTPAALGRLDAMFRAERNPNRKLLIDNYIPVGITISGTITVDPRHVADTVLKATNDTVLQVFSFEHRHFAEPVYLSDVVAALQGVDGVTAVDIDTLDLKSADAAFRHEHGIDDLPGRPQPRLLMLPARWSELHARVLPAELAVIEIPALDVTLRTTGGI